MLDEITVVSFLSSFTWPLATLPFVLDVFWNPLYHSFQYINSLEVFAQPFLQVAISPQQPWGCYTGQTSKTQSWGTAFQFLSTLAVQPNSETIKFLSPKAFRKLSWNKMKKTSTSLGNDVSQWYPESLALFQNSWVVQRRIFFAMYSHSTRTDFKIRNAKGDT